MKIEKGRLRDPRLEKLRDYRSGGYRRWPSIGARYNRTSCRNFLQEQKNRKARRTPVLDEHGEGIIPVSFKTVEWDLW